MGNSNEHGLRVLIADDSVVSRHLLEATLRGWGYEVAVACDGDQAWKILQGDNPPRLAILDWMMPQRTGVDVCKLVREQGREPYTYVLLLTSRSLREDLIAGMEAGADDYVVKPFDQHELKVRLRAGTRIVELQAELLATREAMREQATRDSLTRLYNRPVILDVLHRELNRAEREQGSVGVVMIDLDHFKQINDTYGHFTGDAVLREAARRMQASIRPYDSVGRYGGEEFLMILPGCEPKCTFSQAERIRLAISEEPMRLGDRTLALSASFGCTTGIAGSQCTPESLIRLADEALYQAKHAGRNRVIYRPYPPRPSTAAFVPAEEPART